jgi:hypothetical protein
MAIATDTQNERGYDPNQSPSERSSVHTPQIAEPSAPRNSNTGASFDSEVESGRG